jgi:hypothetical protein
MANARTSTKGKGGRNTARNVEREVTIPGAPFQVQNGEIHGTPSDPNKTRNGAYAASSVIERGTVHKLAPVETDDGKHVCACGCGQQPSQRSSVFMPGHDSKVRAMGKAVLEGRATKGSLNPVARKYLEEGGMLG